MKFSRRNSVERIGIIGGTGVYDSSLLKNSENVKVNTPYGSPSDLITIGEFMGKKIAFIPRHSAKHTINPTKVNYRANIYALKELGVTRIISITAVGSLKEEIKPGDFVFTDQFVDFTKFRKNTFYEGQKVAHISIPKPFCEEIRNILINTAKQLNYDFHEKGTCVVIEGPRFSTIAESEMFRKLGFDTINMTMVPEVILARELGMCYANISMVTDYDVWKEHFVTQDEVSKIMRQNIEKVKNILKNVIPKIKYEGKCSCRKAAEIMFL
ncbi:MAG: S-methyl-5'-thioadenosine phosphorylase [Candidatus Woesearchaeota archaeon]